MLWLKSDEQRETPRYPLERLAKLQPTNGDPSSYCLVTDISGGGVRLTGFSSPVPDEFVLLLAGDGPAQNGTYHVIWRLGSDVGAKLLEPAVPDA